MVRLLTFDIFGTVLDWKSGLERSLGRPLTNPEFDRFIDYQGSDEQANFRTYREITARSLVEVFGLDPQKATAIGAEVGRWPLFPDSVEGMRRLQAIAPCVALTNSDFAHGEQVQEQLGFHLSDWICAEEIRSYKPSLGHWEAASRRLGMPFGPDWWHVSAYGDYDLSVTAKLGLKCVYIARPHCRPGPADHSFTDLLQLAGMLDAPVR